MKKLFKKVVSVGLTSAMMLSMAITGIASASAATYYYNTYSTVADIKNRDGCSAMQGMAVGSTYLYTVKIKDDNSGAVLQKTNKNTGATTNLTNSTGKIYTYLNHANDMDVTTIDGYSQLFVATMATGSNSLVRIKVNGSKATKSGGYTLMYNGAQKSVSGVAIEGTDANNVYFLFKSGATVYRGTVPKSATSGTINITKAFTLNTSSVKVNGTTQNLSSYTHQGMGCYDGKIFVPLWGGGAGKSNQAVIVVYNTANASGSVTADPNLSFRITSGAYTGFEIESCDISSDGKMYFNVNRWTSKSGNHDAILCFNGYTYNSSIFTPVSAPAPAPAPAPATLSIYNQSIADVGTGFYAKIVNVNSNKDVAVDCSNTNGNVIIFDKTNVEDHIWRFDRYADGSYKITNMYNGKCLDLAGGANSDGANVGIWDDNGGSNQKWYIYNYNGAYALKPACSDRVIDVAGGSTANGADVTSWTFNGGANQLFTIEHADYKPLVNLGTNFYANIVNVNANKELTIDASNNNVVLFDRNEYVDHVWKFDRYDDGSYKITNMDNGKCLDLAGGVNYEGANVGFWEDNGGNNQKWFIYEYQGNYVIKSACGDCYLDIFGASTANGANVQMWTFNGDKNQQFAINKVSSDRGWKAYLGESFNAKIVNVNADKDVAVDCSNANNNVVIYDKSECADHIWRFDRYADGSYKITNLINGKCLDVCGGTGAAGVNVALWEDNGGSNQRWYIYKYNGNYLLKSACADCYLDVFGSGTDNFTNVLMWDFNGGINQQFTIDKV